MVFPFFFFKEPYRIKTNTYFFVKQGIFDKNWKKKAGNSFQVVNLAKKKTDWIENFLLCKWSKMGAYMHMHAWIMNTPNYKYNTLVPAWSTKVAQFYGLKILISIKGITL